MFTAELPGFYYDITKKRYFPIKGPIPGSFRLPSSSSSISHEVNHTHLAGKRIRKSSYLLEFRELHGGFITARKFRCNFKQEYQNLQASHSIVWGYSDTHSVADSTLESLPATIQTSSGLTTTTLLVAGSMKGYVCFYEVGGVGQLLGFGPKRIPELVWPSDPAHGMRQSTQLANVWTSAFTTSPLSNVTCIKRIGHHESELVDSPSSQHAFMTTLGSGISGGSVYVLNLAEPLDTSDPGIEGRISKIASLACTIWTASYSTNGNYAALGTNLGGALINLETGNLSWIHRSRSSIFSQHFDQSGNVVICGFRNGSIIPVDVRQRRSGSSDLLAMPHSTATAQVARAPGSRHCKTSDNQLIQRKKNSSTTSMSSAVCSLLGLRTDDQYFFGSSMDGNIKLFDLRLLHRGAVQSYKGHVNSHSHLQLGVDPSESLLMSGAEDCRLRIWSIKTGELVFAEKVSNSVLSSICWDHTGENSYVARGSLAQHPSEDHNFSAWLGSWEGLYYLNGF